MRRATSATSALAPRPAAPPPIRPAEAGDVRTRILAAALELFAERGFAAATTAELARRARVAEKTIFAHFKSKDALFEQTVSPATVDLLIPQIKTPLTTVATAATTAGTAAPNDPASSLEEFLIRLMRNRVDVFGRHPAKFKLIVQELLLSPERARRFAAEIDQPFHLAIEDAFRQFQRKGALREMPMARLHRLFLSALLGYAISRFIVWPDRAWDDDAEIRATVSALVNGLSPRSAPERRSASRAPATRPRTKRTRKTSKA